ncbi:unnamed protein product [Rotaria sp. Silwood2]|nr:unnamed protein product [Rotaria sp. Silwood2]CAF2668465.1 unnamed protein product [Rotaria sp. Silwood2]CAF2945590.1 unnamed protein product [Rotaria sp. Silwood2]CAF3410906.1 unnamed protein product [Rotaria sp. Silwood2]CAF4324341.1 unnamed protein product [Rotaria sp. Silwood2]
MASASDYAPSSPIYHCNVIVFGESGVGKSSLINQIFDKIVVKASNQALGCTTENARISSVLTGYSGISCDIYDTVGLSESADGSVPTETAFVQLIKLAYAIPNGINLLICCHNKGRIANDRFKANYRIFKQELCGNRIPCLLVITNCDGDEPLDEWWIENEEVVRKRLLFDFIDCVCVSTLKTKKNKPNVALRDYQVSRDNLIRAIIARALPKPIKIDSWSRKVIIAAREFFNTFSTWFSWFGVRKATLRPELKQMFISLNYSEEKAEQATEKLLRELADKDLQAPYRDIEA